MQTNLGYLSQMSDQSSVLSGDGGGNLVNADGSPVLLTTAHSLSFSPVSQPNVEELRKLIEDGKRYRKLKARGPNNDKLGRFAFGGNARRAEGVFGYWCTPERLDELIDAMPDPAQETNNDPAK